MRGIRIITTYICNIMCSHCLYSCSPIRKGAMDINTFKREVEAALKEGYDEYIIIEGGEALLYSGMIFKYLKSLQHFNMDKYLVTNGFWGGLDPYVDIIRDLKLKGLNGVIIEYDYLHSVFIDMDTIRLAIKKCRINDVDVKLRSIFLSGNIDGKEDRKTYEIIKSLKKEFGDIEVVFEEVGSKGYIMPSKRRSNEKLILLEKEKKAAGVK